VRLPAARKRRRAAGAAPSGTSFPTYIHIHIYRSHQYVCRQVNRLYILHRGP